jgi:hypothetical protein
VIDAVRLFSRIAMRLVLRVDANAPPHLLSTYLEWSVLLLMMKQPLANLLFHASVRKVRVVNDMLSPVSNEIRLAAVATTAKIARNGLAHTRFAREFVARAVLCHARSW